VRQALGLALDRDTLIGRLFANVSVRADAILPPGMPGYSTDLPRLPFDANAAKAALAKSKYAGNMPVLVLNESGQGGQPSAYLTAVADMWRQNLGLKVQIKQLDPTAYTAAARAQHGNVLTYGWCADYPDPENFLDILFHTGGDFNVSGYSDPQVDTWLEAARTEVDGSQRLALYHQVEAKLLADGVVIPFVNQLSDVVVKPYVKGFTLSPMETALTSFWSLEYGSASK
jgi:oligopeptide transport system substrate-binding protein